MPALLSLSLEVQPIVINVHSLYQAAAEDVSL